MPFSSPETGPSPEQFQEAQRDPRLAWLDRQTFAQQFPGENAVAMVNGGMLQERVQQFYGEEALSRIRQTLGGLRNSGLHEQVSAANFPAQTENALTQIIDRLLQDGPDEVGGAPNQAAQYLTQLGEGTNARYGVSATRIRNDLRTVRLLMESAANPQQLQALQSIASALEGYGWNIDPLAMSVREYNDMRSNSPVNRSTRQGLRFLGVVLGGTLAVINGVVSHQARTASIAPFVYGGIALLAANPSLIHGRARHTAQQAADAIGRLHRGGLASHNDIQGQEWAGFAQDIMQNGADAQTLRYLRQQAPLTSEQREHILTTLAPEAGTQRTTVERMLDDGSLRTFLVSLQGVRDTDARELVETYIREGAWRFGNAGGVFG